MKAIKFLLVAMVAIIFASCGPINGVNKSPINNNVPEINLILKEANYQIVGEATGEWSATYVFGIGGLSEKALETNALSEMYKNAQLTGTQQIINVTTTISKQQILVYTKKRVIAHGYIIEFVK